jgi:hypothetical protein
MADPLTDPRAQGLLSAQPGEAGALAGSFRRVSSQAQTAASALRGAQSDVTWCGQAADAFRTQLGKLPGDLDKVQQSYGHAADALDSYESELGPLQVTFRTLAGQLDQARTNLTGAQGRAGTAQSALTTATQAPHATSSTPAVVNAHSAVQAANGAVATLQDQVSGLERSGFSLLDEFDTVRGHARSAISSAAGLAPQHHSSWFSSAWHSVGNFMSGTGHFFAKMGTDVWDAAKSLPSDVANVVEHPTDLEKWAKLGEDVGTVAGAVALVAAVAICPADALGLEAVVGVAETAEGGAAAVATYAGIEKTAADTGLVAEGKGSISKVAFDVVNVAATKIEPGAGGAESDVEHLAGKSSALEQYGVNRAEGATAAQAYSALTAEQRSMITSSTRALANPARLNYMRSTTLDRLAGAETHLYHVKALNEIGHHLFEGTSKAVQGVVIPEPRDGAPAAAG